MQENISIASLWQKETRLSVGQTGLLVETIGIEPMTSCMSSKRSNHLGYASEACILYHTILQIASVFWFFYEKYFLC